MSKSWETSTAIWVNCRFKDWRKEWDLISLQESSTVLFLRWPECNVCVCVTGWDRLGIWQQLENWHHQPWEECWDRRGGGCGVSQSTFHNNDTYRPFLQSSCSKTHQFVPSEHVDYTKNTLTDTWTIRRKTDSRLRKILLWCDYFFNGILLVEPETWWRRCFQ